MKVQTVYCDVCNKNNNVTIITSYLVQPKMGEEGYLIDQETIDLCDVCLVEYMIKHPRHDVFHL